MSKTRIFHLYQIWYFCERERYCSFFERVNEIIILYSSFFVNKLLYFNIFLVFFRPVFFRQSEFTYIVNQLSIRYDFFSPLGFNWLAAIYFAIKKPWSFYSCWYYIHKPRTSSRREKFATTRLLWTSRNFGTREEIWFTVRIYFLHT